MNTYTIRPYFGYDCNSDQGFNDGRYLDEIEVEAESEDAAIDVAIRMFKAADPTWGTGYDNSQFQDDVLYREFDHMWRDSDGNEIPETGTDDNCYRECFFRYQYISFDEVSHVRT